MIGTRKSIRIGAASISAGLILGIFSNLQAQTASEKPASTPESLLETPVDFTGASEMDASSQTEAPKVDPTPEASASPALTERKKTGTTITADKEATFNNEERKASFSGNVRVSDPEFDLTCDTLYVFLSGSKEGGEVPGGQSSSSLRKAVAEGNVAVVQRRTGDDGVEKVYRGNAGHGVYNATTGEFELSEWPKVQQGINSHIGTEKSTRITITKDGKMLTEGPSRTVIEETPDES